MEELATRKVFPPVAEDKGRAVRVRRLTAGYETAAGQRTVLASIDFDLQPGTCLSVVGPSGCGKSTLLHVLAGLVAPLGGEVSVDGRIVSAPGRQGASGHAAYMFQEDLLLPWKSVLANAVFPAQLSSRKGDRARPRAELEERARGLLWEFGLGGRLDALPHELSGGMRQRVALARTLVLSRGLVLLDEPFGSLDALTRADLQGWLLQVMDSHPATWVLVTHDVHEAVLLADRVAVLGGDPARLEGWVEVPVDRECRAGTGGPAVERALGQTAAQVRRLLLKGRDP